MRKDNNFYALILAGGSGLRFWPASRESLPKQFVDLTGSGKTLIQETFVRINKIIKTKNRNFKASIQNSSLEVSFMFNESYSG